jgi:hypothetical protein
MFASPEQERALPHDVLHPGMLGPIMQDDAVRADLVARRNDFVRTEEYTRSGQVGLTQKEAASGLLWSQSKVIQVETGVVKLQPADARYMMKHYGATDEECEQVVDTLFATKYEKTLQRKRYGGDFSDTTLRYVEQENYARVGRYYGQYALPAIVQAPGYAEIIDKHYDHHNLQALETLRTDRARHILGQRGPKIEIVINEAALVCSVGAETGIANSRGRMLDQIEYIKRLNTVGRAMNAQPLESQLNPNISVQIQRFVDTDPGPIEQDGTVTSFEFPNETLESVAYRHEPWDEDFTKYDAPGFAAQFNKAFQFMVDCIPGPDATEGILDGIKHYHM